MKTLAVVAGLFGLGWLVTRKPKKKKRPKGAPAPFPTAPEPSPQPPPPPPPTGNYVGSGWTNWPHKDKFPDQASFGQSLQLLGYNSGGWNSPNWTVLDPTMREAVVAFQEDHNFLMAFRKYMEQEGNPPAAGLPPIRADLGVDGLLGPATIPALADAFVYSDVTGKSWYEIIDGAEEELQNLPTA